VNGVSAAYLLVACYNSKRLPLLLFCPLYLMRVSFTFRNKFALLFTWIKPTIKKLLLKVILILGALSQVILTWSKTDAGNREVINVQWSTIGLWDEVLIKNLAVGQYFSRYHYNKSPDTSATKWIKHWKNFKWMNL